MDPVRALPFNVMSSNEVTALMELGIVPTREFVSMLRNVRDCIAPRLDGIVPLKRFL